MKDIAPKLIDPEVICILRFDYKKLLIFIVIICSAFITFSFNVSAANDSQQETIARAELEDGIYNIINAKTGHYLNVYEGTSSDDQRLFLSSKNGHSTQDFLVKRQDDSTYAIYPQSESGTYSLSYSKDILESEFICKKEIATGQSKFLIVPTQSGHGDSNGFLIKPAGMSDGMLVLSLTSKSNGSGQTLVGIAVENLQENQVWEFVKTSAKTLNLDGRYVDMKVATKRSIFSMVTPEYLSKNIVWKSNNTSIASVNSKGVVIAHREGRAVITASCGTKSVSITVNVSPYTAFTWYSQHNNYDGGWYAEMLNNIYFTTWGGARKRFFVKGYANNYDWMDQGCKLCAEAMVLHNMGAVLTEGYDFRTGKTNNLEADPYTVALANGGTDGVDYNNMWVSNNPILIDHSMINPRFNLNGNAITTQDYYGGNLSHIKELLEQHPEGVIVGMANYAKNTTHWVVFTECLNPDDPYGNYEFRICDPVADTPELGDNVPFKKSASYLNLGYGYWSIFGYSVYNVVQ